MNIKVLVLDTQVYSNTGGQSSTATFMGQNTKFTVHGKAIPSKIERRKEFTLICMHPNTFVAHTTCAMSNHFCKVVVSETLHYAAKKQAEKAYATGYDKGKSDAMKQQYWLYVSMQKQRNQVGSVRLYPVKLPEQRIDGVTFQPSTKYLRIEE
jgi:pyruvate/2-oxoacid:ferredoxin oxidoreductase beta subunit